MIQTINILSKFWTVGDLWRIMEIPSYKFERVDMFEFLPNMIEVLFLWDNSETEKKSKSEDEEEDERKRKEIFLSKWEDEEEDEKKMLP